MEKREPPPVPKAAREPSPRFSEGHKKTPSEKGGGEENYGSGEPEPGEAN